MLLRLMTTVDRDAIGAWPPYPEEFRDLDYAVRSGGWLDDYFDKPGNELFVGMHEGNIAGFSILSKDSAASGRAEFRIALAPDMIGKGLGRSLTWLTVRNGFNSGLTEIFLIVRKNNERARALYEHIGFFMTGECRKDVHGVPVDFYTMSIDRMRFKDGEAQ